MKRKQIDIQDFTISKKVMLSTPNKDTLLQEKKNSCSLRSHKIAYARDEDSTDTMNLRSFYPDSPEDLRKYGIKGLEDMKILFLSILRLIDTTDKDELILKAKYVTPAQISAVYELIKEKKEEIEELKLIATTKETSNTNVFTFVVMPNSS